MNESLERGDTGAAPLPGELSIIRRTKAGGVETFVRIKADGSITAFNGHVDLGTGIRTALGQIVAEEMYVAFERVNVVLGHTAHVPDQGATIASETIQIAAVPLRKAAAQARKYLILRGAELLGVPSESVTLEDGILRGKANQTLELSEIVAGQRWEVELDELTEVKSVDKYRVVGSPVARVDLPAKATGETVYVHDIRLPGMVHGRVVRPPYAGLDAGEFIGTSLLKIDEASVKDIPGLIAVVRIADFVGVVCEREENAIRAAQQLAVSWKPLPPFPNLADIPTALRANPSKPRVLIDKGDIDSALKAVVQPIKREYVWPYQMHASIGPSCAVADYGPDRLQVWSGTQNPHVLRADLALLLNFPEAEIDVIRMEAAGCYGRNCADDVSADAALLSRAVGRPVRVQLTREQEHVWEPKGAGQLIEVNGGLNKEGRFAAYDFSTRYPSNLAPTLALLLTGALPPVPGVIEMGDRTAIPPYDIGSLRVVVHDMPPIVRASWLRAVSALPNTFAHESYIDELAVEAGVDPIQFRLDHLEDQRGSDLIRSVAERAAWVSRPVREDKPPVDGSLKGRGFAYALHMHGKFPGVAAAWSAWVADVSVDQQTGEVNVTRVVAGQDAGLIVNPDGARHQIQGNVIQSTSRVLMEEVAFDQKGITSKEWGAYPIIRFPDVPKVDVLLMSRHHEPPLGIGEASSIPSAAAIANAIYDATGVRFRELPFTPERIREGLEASRKKTRSGFRRSFWGSLIALGAVTLGALGTLAPWRAAIPPIPRPDPSAYSASTIARGRQLAAVGDCGVCHTLPGGAFNAGGRALQTPFGTIYSTNITPDPLYGIGSWSYSAFERAMREGIHRDGKHLYPAFPYTHFAKSTDADLQALYAYLMAQPAVSAPAPSSTLNFPFNLRPLLAGWKLLHHSSDVYELDSSKSVEWNRGAYLVEGLGHCSACHSPRNLLGAEKVGTAYLAGGVASAWDAPALNSLSIAPVPWTEDEFFTYLRSGSSRYHGIAAGPMAPVIKELGLLPDEDIRAMAVYLASIAGSKREATEIDKIAQAVERNSRHAETQVFGVGRTLYGGACAACHESGALQNLRTPSSLAFNTNLHSENPDNLIHVILRGTEPALPEGAGYMPSFAESFSDQQISDLVRYLRSRFAPDKAAWGDVEAIVGRLRTVKVSH